MTDNEFQELDLNKDISDMEDDEARETLVDFMQAHQENQVAYDETVSEFESKIDDINEEKEAVEETLGEIKANYAERASEVTHMPAELIEERFSFSEIEQILAEAEEAGEFSETEAGSETEEEEEPDNLTNFAERGEKGKQGKEETRRTEYRDEASTLLRQKGVPVSNEE